MFVVQLGFSAPLRCLGLESSGMSEFFFVRFFSISFLGEVLHTALDVNIMPVLSSVNIKGILYYRTEWSSSSCEELEKKIGNPGNPYRQRYQETTPSPLDRRQISVVLPWRTPNC